MMIGVFVEGHEARGPLTLPSYPSANPQAQAAALCSSPALEKMPCSFAAEAELNSTLEGLCPFCGALWQAPLTRLPTRITGHASYFQLVREAEQLFTIEGASSLAAATGLTPCTSLP